MGLNLICDCGKALVAKDDLAGKRIKCPACARILAVRPPVDAPSATEPVVPKQSLAKRPQPKKVFRSKKETHALERRQLHRIRLLVGLIVGVLGSCVIAGMVLLIIFNLPSGHEERSQLELEKLLRQLEESSNSADRMQIAEGYVSVSLFGLGTPPRPGEDNLTYMTRATRERESRFPRLEGEDDDAYAKREFARRTNILAPLLKGSHRELRYMAAGWLVGRRQESWTAEIRADLRAILEELKKDDKTQVHVVWRVTEEVRGERITRELPGTEPARNRLLPSIAAALAKNP